MNDWLRAVLLMVGAIISIEPVQARLAETATPSTDFTCVRSLIALREPLGDEIDPIFGAGMNAVFPGSGYLMQGNAQKGIACAIGGAALLGGALLADAEEEEKIRNNLLLIYQNFSFLTAWDIYYPRVAEMTPHAERPALSRPGLDHFLRSPIDPGTFLTWEVLLPVTIAGGLAWAFVCEADEDDRAKTDDWAGKQPLIFGQSTLIGAGEELFFRGVIFPEMAVRARSETLGLLGQAALFGLGHLDPEGDGRENAARFGFSTMFGLYAGWVGLHRPNGLRKAIAMHMWWDMIVLSADYLEDGEAEPILRYSFRF